MAWLFVPASHLKTALAQFGPDVNGPQGLPERSFVAQLDHLGIPYRVVDAGLFEAVVPSRAVTPSRIDTRDRGRHRTGQVRLGTTAVAWPTTFSSPSPLSRRTSRSTR